MKDNQQIIESLKKHKINLIESDDLFIQFLKKSRKTNLAKVILDQTSPEDHIVYYGDEMVTDAIYYIVKTAFDNQFDPKYVREIADKINKGLKNLEVGPILKDPEKTGLFGKEEVEDGRAREEIEQQAKEEKCRPEEIMINYSGADDSWSDLLQLTYIGPDIEELLTLINTQAAKKYISAIKSNSTIQKAKNMHVFEY